MVSEKIKTKKELGFDIVNFFIKYSYELRKYFINENNWVNL